MNIEKNIIKTFLLIGLLLNLLYNIYDMYLQLILTTYYHPS